MTRLEKLTCLSLLKYTDFLRLRPCQRHSCVGVPSRISVNKKVVYIGVCLLRKDFFNKKEVYEFTFSPSLFDILQYIKTFMIHSCIYDGGLLSIFGALKRHYIHCVIVHTLTYWRFVPQTNKQPFNQPPGWSCNPAHI